MELRRYKCEEFILRLAADPSAFLPTKFFSDPRVSGLASEWGKGSPLNLLHYTKNPRTADYHAHTGLRLSAKKVRLTLTWVLPALRKPRGASYPFAEDVLGWIDGFFKKRPYLARVSAFYRFPTSRYISSLGLPAPLFWSVRKRRPRTIVGMTVSARIEGALDATVDTRLVGKRALAVGIMASYNKRIVELGPEGLLPGYASLVNEFAIRG
jgi:hypothetical protein